MQVYPTSRTKFMFGREYNSSTHRLTAQRSSHCTLHIEHLCTWHDSLELLLQSIHPSIHGLCARWCPMSSHFLTTVSFLAIGLALVSRATVLMPITFPFAFHISVFYIHSSSPAIGFHSCFFFTADVSAPIWSTLHLFTF